MVQKLCTVLMSSLNVVILYHRILVMHTYIYSYILDVCKLNECSVPVQEDHVVSRSPETEKRADQEWKQARSEETPPAPSPMSHQKTARPRQLRHRQRRTKLCSQSWPADGFLPLPRAA